MGVFPPCGFHTFLKSIRILLPILQDMQMPDSHFRIEPKQEPPSMHTRNIHLLQHKHTYCRRNRVPANNLPMRRVPLDRPQKLSHMDKYLRERQYSVAVHPCRGCIFLLFVADFCENQKQSFARAKLCLYQFQEFLQHTKQIQTWQSMNTKS